MTARFATRTSSTPVGLGLLLTLGALTGLSPFSVDVAISAFPEMVVDLATTPAGVQLSLTSYLIGMAVGMPIFGVLSDRLGRRGPLLLALAVCVVASIVTAIAPTLLILIAARSVQGAAAAGGVVIARAVVSDLATGNVAARVFSFMVMVGGIAPIVAPVIGSWAALLGGWRATFWVLLGLVMLVLVITLFVVPESNGPDVRRGNRELARATDSKPLRALVGRQFLGNTLSMTFVTMLMFGYVSASPFLYQSVLGFGPEAFALIFGASAFGMLAVNWFSTRLIGIFTVRAILLTGLAVTVVTVLVLLVLVLAGVRNGWLIPPLMIMVSCTGATLPKSTALAMAEVRQIAGTGSAVLGALQYGLGALITPFVTLGNANSPVLFVMLMTAAAAAATVAAVLAGKPRENPQAPAVAAELSPEA